MQSQWLSHQDAFSHHFDGENAKILDNESNYKQRITSEMIDIKYHLNNVNKKEDIFTLSKTYFPVLRKFKCQLTFAIALVFVCTFGSTGYINAGDYVYFVAFPKSHY